MSTKCQNYILSNVAYKCQVGSLKEFRQTFCDETFCSVTYSNNIFTAILNTKIKTTKLPDQSHTDHCCQNQKRKRK